MAIHRLTPVSVVLIVGFLWNPLIAQSLRFDLQSGHTKCITEDIKTNSMSVGKYSIVNPSDGHPMPDSHKLTVRVTSTYGNSYHYAEHVESGQFAFQTAEAGDYMACFWADDHKPQTTITVEFDWKSGVATKDWTNVAKKGSVDEADTSVVRGTHTVPQRGLDTTTFMRLASLALHAILKFVRCRNSDLLVAKLRFDRCRYLIVARR
ncbi:transmembrane emp24 domain-containing protein p24delta9-like isoform X2 [Actinidia eriantha]|uniref:transmembrane emp24 domain-containing protein p24delta9-like isoform X2 n=1 Tax=Actinidia eriantha TaxID=165200 RepID=UPI00258B9549|nr:transmembrane emp24 domain-containing protein p24delta9-like isoform X2 [Actinidia eriantha]